MGKGETLMKKLKENYTKSMNILKKVTTINILYDLA